MDETWQKGYATGCLEARPYREHQTCGKVGDQVRCSTGTREIWWRRRFKGDLGRTSKSLSWSHPWMQVHAFGRDHGGETEWSALGQEDWGTVTKPENRNRREWVISWCSKLVPSVRKNSRNGVEKEEIWNFRGLWGRQSRWKRQDKHGAAEGSVEENCRRGCS